MVPSLSGAGVGTPHSSLLFYSYHPAMSPILGWSLAALVVATAWQTYGWQGAVFAVSVVVFWLVLQFNRSIRVMKNASSAPVGHVPNAVMFNAKLKQGVPLLQVITLTNSLGQKVSGKAETWRWTDEGGSSVTLVFDEKGRLKSWTLDRPVEDLPAP